MTDWIVAGIADRLFRMLCLAFVAGAVLAVVVWHVVAWLIHHVRIA